MDLTRAVVVSGMLVVATGTAGAEPADDGYCDYVTGVASATSAVQLAPELIAQFGYVEQPPTAANPDVSNNGLRLIAGVRYRLTGIYEGLATRDHGRADCRRHEALEQVRGETTARALAARAKVLDDALREADAFLQQADADLGARRTTAQEATATRLRVEELRDLATETHRQLAALPPVTARPLAAALAAYQAADADLEQAEAKLRRAQAFDVSVRFGLDEFVNATNPTPYFAVVAVGINLGALAQGSGNERAAAGRRRMLVSGHDPLAVDATADRLRATIELESRRAKELAALVGELERQLDALAKVGGDDSKRYRQTVWFDAVKARAEAAYLTAHLASLHDVLGGAP